MFLTAPNDKLQTPKIDWVNTNNHNNVVDVNEDLTHSNSTDSNGIPVEQQQLSHQCPKCTKSFKRGDHLKRHLLSVHDQDLPYYCGDCPKAFVSPLYLTKHCETAHFGVTKKGPFCGWCGSKFWNVQDLERHAILTHQKQDADYLAFINKTCKVFGCPYCQKTVSNEKILNRHIEKMHSTCNNKSHVCLNCLTTFASVNELEAHYKDCHANNVVSKNEQCLTPESGNYSPTPNMKSFQYNNIVQSPNALTKQLKNQIVNGNSKFNVSISSADVPGRTLLNNSCENSQLVDSNLNRVLNPNSRAPSSTTQNIAFSNKKSKKSCVKNLGHFTNADHKEPNTVSEALSLAMKALSEFSYDDLFCHSDEYVPSGFSVFQSTSPLPNFHYPNTVHFSNLLDDETANQSGDSDLSAADLKNNAPHLTKALLDNGNNNRTPAPPNSSLVQHSPASQAPNDVNSSSVIGKSIQGALSIKVKVKNCGSFSGIDGNGQRKFEADPNEAGNDSYKTMIMKGSENGPNLKFICTFCNESFEGVDNVMRHIELIHMTPNTQECCLCKKRFAQAGNVKRHIRFVHLRERPFQCNDCDSTFDRLCYLQRHMRSHVNSKENGGHLFPSNCPECGRQCLTLKHLRGHMRRKHFAKNKETSNEMMKKYDYIFGGENKMSTKNNKAAAKLIKDENKSKKPTPVNEVLNRSSKRKYKVRNFRAFSRSASNGIGFVKAFKNSKTKKKLLPFKCRRCAGRGFPKLSLLRSHVAIAHQRNFNRHICYSCGITYSVKAMLTSHIKKRHAS